MTFGHRFLQLTFDKVRDTQRSTMDMGLSLQHHFNASYTPHPHPQPRWNCGNFQQIFFLFFFFLGTDGEIFYLK